MVSLDVRGRLLIAARDVLLPKWSALTAERTGEVRPPQLAASFISWLRRFLPVARAALSAAMLFACCGNLPEALPRP